LARSAASLQENRNYLLQLHDEEKMIEKELSILKTFQQVFQEMYAYPPDAAERRRIVAALHIPALKKQAAATGNFNASCMASRLLGKIVINAQEVSMDFWGRKDYRRAAWFLELAMQTGVEQWYHRYNLACVYVKLDEKKKALRIIESMIETGFDQAGFLENDPDLSPLLKEKGFRELLARMKHKK
jgi:TPR repeat protein